MVSKKNVSIIIACLLWMSGCYLPYPKFHAKGYSHTRGAIRTKDAAFIKPGVTTSVSLLRHFGEPDYISENEQIWIYTWDMFIAMFVVDRSTGIPINHDHHCLIIYMDEQGIITQTQRAKHRLQENHYKFLKKVMQEDIRSIEVTDEYWDSVWEED